MKTKNTWLSQFLLLLLLMAFALVSCDNTSPDECQHTWETWSVLDGASCSSVGTKTRKCSKCDYTETETIPAIAHTEIQIINKEPTCTKQGETAYTCSVCGKVRIVNTAPTGHNYDSGVVIKEASNKVTATKKYTCTSCGDVKEEDIAITNEQPDITNIALFLIDSSNPEEYTGSIESIMILSLNKIHNKVKVASVMCNTLVHIEDHGYCKINSAYTEGGLALTLKTLNESFDLNIRHYITVNFAGIINIIDTIGGVEVEITEAERLAVNRLIVERGANLGTEKDDIQKAGLQTLTGVQAVCWSQLHSVPTSDGIANDFGRTDRQRVLMEAMFHRITGMDTSQYSALTETLLSYIYTSLSSSEIIDMVGTVLKGTTFEQTRIPQIEYIINADYREKTGSSTVYYNLDYAAKVLHAFVYDDIMPADYMKQTGVDRTPWAQ